jgi:hypothetical protein
MESPADYLDSPMDADDIPYPCKGCGEVRCFYESRTSWPHTDSLFQILEEGKAFELGK